MRDRAWNDDCADEASAVRAASWKPASSGLSPSPRASLAGDLVVESPVSSRFPVQSVPRIEPSPVGCYRGHRARSVQGTCASNREDPFDGGDRWPRDWPGSTSRRLCDRVAPRSDRRRRSGPLRQSPRDSRDVRLRDAGGTVCRVRARGNWSSTCGLHRDGPSPPRDERSRPTPRCSIPGQENPRGDHHRVDRRRSDRERRTNEHDRGHDQTDRY